MAATRERTGRPTQFHGVALEDRAFDAQGNRLPWALEYPDDHPNQRLSKRQPEEKGSFGKATRRKGSSRVSRTQTPAKKENPALDGFEAALKLTATQQESQRVLSNASSGAVDHTHILSTTKEPTQVMLYGYSPDTQWAALQFYEQVSGGMICEDYERGPPAERKRFYSGLETTHAPRRALTKEEKSLAMRYSGGVCWIKVTLDSREAAERAIAASPHALQGHWVYAEAFKGQGPDVDEPILVRDEDRETGLLGAARPPQHKSATLGASSAPPLELRSPVQQRGSSTLPRSFVARESSQQDDASVASTATASSATATIVDAGGVRRRDAGAELGQVVPVHESLATFSRFPDKPRTVLRPASEALLPQMTWSERVVKSLREGGWIPGDMIGTVVPRLESGEFDWASASFYWKLFYWIDCTLGTDLCGLKEG